MFSNFIYVLNHLVISEQNGFIPIIDMENFTTIYNEKEKIDNTFNAWEYYFEKINKYSLREVYTSKNVILSSSNFQQQMSLDIENKRLTRYLKKIIVKNKFRLKANNFYKKNFKKKDKVLGVHFRGSTYKTARGHAYPSTISEMIKNIYNLLNDFHYDKIFLVTEEMKYLMLLIKNLKTKWYFMIRIE